MLLARDIDVSLNVSAGLYVLLGGSHLMVLKLDLIENHIVEVKRITIKCDGTTKMHEW